MSLDDKLREIHKDDYNCIGHAEGQLCCLELPEVIAEIKQALAAEGYIKVSTFADGKIKSAQLFTIDHGSYEVCSGEEWYDRFKKEYEETFSEKTMGDVVVRSTIMQAAKKAAGLSDD